MNVDIANILNAFITPLPFIDRNAGLVKTITFNTLGGGTKSIPVACDVTHAECVKAGSKVTALVPDSGVKSISYWEDQGIRRSGDDHKDFCFESSLRLVVWLNLKKMGKMNCSYSALAVMNILKAIPTGVFNSPPYTRIRVTSDGEILKDKNIFSRYTYEEDKVQYLMYPFDYFAMDFTVKFCIPEVCIEDWTNEPPIC